MRLTDAEWSVLEVLWSGERFALREVTEQLKATKAWNKNTVHTYLTRMEAKGLVNIDHSNPLPYAAAVSRETCARDERNALLSRVYRGAAGDMIAAFLRDSTISPDEAAKLRRMLDEMEV